MAARQLLQHQLYTAMQISVVKTFRACFKIRSGPAVGDFGCGQGGEFRASPQRAVRNESTQATGKRPAARRVFAQKARRLRCGSVTAPCQGCSLVAPRHRAFCAKTDPLLILKQALTPSFICTLWLVATSQFDLSAASPSARLAEEVYVWQRAWTPAVVDAVAAHGGTFSNVVALAAEVSWRHGKPDLVHVPVNYGALAAVQGSIGLALRIGPFSGSFATNDAVAQELCSLAASILAEAATNHVKPSELQLDFDCADSRLNGYRLWVEAIRRRITPLPLTITALPSWLKQPGFRELVAASDGYVLQVHSLEKPKGYDAPFILCDPKAVLAAVGKASSFGVPFRVALPTCGYLIAFATNGEFVGLSAEGPAKTWPPDARLQEVRSDPIAMATLVQELAAKPPPGLRGIIWYRLPTIVDNLNWRWPTLNAIVHSRSCRARALDAIAPSRVRVGGNQSGQ